VAADYRAIVALIWKGWLLLLLLHSLGLLRRQVKLLSAMAHFFGLRCCLFLLCLLGLARKRSQNGLSTAVGEVFIAVEEGLDGGSLEQKRILLNLLGVVTLEGVIFVRLLLVEVVRVLLRLEGSVDFLLE
jgi:hypothetical protein